MGKGELWDDSALINAFHDAISKHKKMHGKGYKENSTGVTGDVRSSNGDSSVVGVVDANHEEKSHLESVDGGNSDASQATVEVSEVENLGTSKGNEVADSQLPEEHALRSVSVFEDQGQDHYSALSSDEYNELYKQYYEIEEQRQNILQKMQQFINHNYTDAGEASVSGVEWGTYSTTQENQYSTTQVPCGMTAASCCPCVCPYPVPSCSSLPCPYSVPCAGTLCTDAPAAKTSGKQLAVDDIVKTVTLAAERAVSSLKDQTSETKEDKSCGTEESACSATDLNVVLNAWYTAGFHTGKYVTEQSFSKKRHG